MAKFHVLKIIFAPIGGLSFMYAKNYFFPAGNAKFHVLKIISSHWECCFLY